MLGITQVLINVFKTICEQLYTVIEYEAFIEISYLFQVQT